MTNLPQHKWLLAAIIAIMAAFQVWSCSLYQPQMTAKFLAFLTLEKNTPSLSCLGEDLLSVVELVATATHGLQATPVGHTYTLWGMQAKLKASENDKLLQVDEILPCGLDTALSARLHCALWRRFCADTC